VDVAMNAQGVAVEQRYGRPVLTGMHAMHSLGGIVGAGAGALAARLELNPFPHFLIVTPVVAVACVAASPLLLPSRIDAAEGSSATMTSVPQWFRGWSAPIVLLGVLAFCVTLAEGAALDWSAVYVDDALGGVLASARWVLVSSWER
jgi:hypothetical protein